MLKTRSLNTSQAAKGDNGNRHRNSLGEKDPTAFLYTQTHTLQRCPWHLRIFSKISPSANEDNFKPSEFILASKGRRQSCESFLFLSVPTLRAEAGQSSPFTKPWQGLCYLSLLHLTTPACWCCCSSSALPPSSSSSPPLPSPSTQLHVLPSPAFTQRGCETFSRRGKRKEKERGCCQDLT